MHYLRFIYHGCIVLCTAFYGVKLKFTGDSYSRVVYNQAGMRGDKSYHHEIRELTFLKTPPPPQTRVAKSNICIAEHCFSSGTRFNTWHVAPSFFKMAFFLKKTNIYFPSVNGRVKDKLFKSYRVLVSLVMNRKQLIRLMDLGLNLLVFF